MLGEWTRRRRSKEGNSERKKYIKKIRKDQLSTYRHRRKNQGQQETTKKRCKMSSEAGFANHEFSGFCRSSTTPGHTAPACSVKRRKISLVKCSSKNSQGQISETTQWTFIFKRRKLIDTTEKLRQISQQEEDSSHFPRTLVVKPTLSQMYDQLLPTSKSLETTCKDHVAHTSVPCHVSVT